MSDAVLTCGHLAAEREVNAARVLDLTGERSNAQSNNLGLFFVSPLFLDLSQTEQQEIRAIERRNAELERLSAARSCT